MTAPNAPRAITAVLDSIARPSNARIADVLSDLAGYESPNVAWLRGLSDQRERARPASDEPQRSPPGTQSQAVGERARLIARVIVRDGDVCWYCDTPLLDDMTIEHRQARTNGGDDDFDNVALAHRRCNRIAGSLPLSEKLRLRVKWNEESRHDAARCSDGC